LVVDVALRIAAAWARHARVLARLHSRCPTLLFRAVEPLELGVRQPLHDRPHRSNSLLVTGDSALIPPMVQKRVDWLISGKIFADDTT
jgi:hypothetical protein